MGRTLPIAAVFLLAAACLSGCGCGDDDDDDNDSAIPDDDATDDDTAVDDDDTADDDDTIDDDTIDDDTADDDIDDDVDALSTHDPLTAASSVLPAGLESCPVIAETECVAGTVRECAVYDALADDFDLDPPPFLNQAYYLDRYADLYFRSDNSGITFRTSSSMAPGTPESTWADPANFERYGDWGDGAFYMGMNVSAAALRYAVTGTDADYERMVGLLDSLLVNWRVSGVPGYMVRSVAAMLDDGVPVPPNHPEYNLRGYTTRGNHVLYALEGDALDNIPAYYNDGVTIDATFYNTTPLAEGSPSQDAYSGAIAGMTRAWSVLREDDADLRDEIVEDVRCMFNRLRKLRITNLSQSLVGELAVQYLTASGGFHPDPDDIDLSTVDTMVGYVEEAIPPGAPGGFEFGCPDDPPFDVDPAYDWDASDPLTLLRIVDLGYKMTGQGDHPIDFVYFVSHRGGDVAYMANYATFLYHATGDDDYRRFIRENLTEEIDGYAILNTLGSFYLPPFCGSWIGGDLIHPILSLTLQMLGDDALADEHRRAMREELKDKLLANDANAFFGVTYGAVMTGADDPGASAYLDDSLDALRGYQLNADYPLDPKRNYSTNYIDDPLPDPDYQPVSPTQADIDACEAGLELFGITLVPGPGIDPDFEQISANPLPVELRVPHDLIWHFSPFNLKREYGGSEGRDHKLFTDFTLPFWLGRSIGAVDEGAGSALAWRDTGVSCP